VIGPRAQEVAWINSDTLSSYQIERLRSGISTTALSEWPPGFSVPEAMRPAPAYRSHPAQKRTVIDAANDAIAALDRRIAEAEARESAIDLAPSDWGRI